mmetsp:Transcript_2379/g.3217  ORF Transcript_2379/g.3217 Transcript_2379/m.3217 type:complete len:148 (+) Transcript_2379:156-599(+)
MSWFHEFNLRHERLKNFVHNGMRYPLPPWGQKVMALVYFTIPVIGGYYIMQWAISKAPTAIEMENQEGVLYGNKRVLDDGQEQVVGARGWGGGVNLAVSDAETQERSSESLKRYMKQLKKQQRQQRKREKEEPAVVAASSETQGKDS